MSVWGKVAVEQGRTAVRSLPRSLGGRERAEKRVPRGPRMGRWPHAFLLGRLPSSALATLGSWAGGLNCFSESQQGGLEGEENGVGLPPHLFDSWL